MTEDKTYDVLNAGIAMLAEPTVVHGVAMGVGDVTNGMSGKETTWPEDVLREGAELLRGKPLVKGHPGVSKDGDDLSVDVQPPVEDIIGEIVDAFFEPGVGLMYEAEVDDEDIARQIERGRADVSPVVSLSAEETGPDSRTVTKIHGFRDLGVVYDGASPSNSIAPGAAAMAYAAMSAAFDEDDSPCDDGAQEDKPQSTGGVDAESDKTMSDEDTLTDAEKELLAYVDDAEGAVESLRQLDGFEDAHVVEQSAYDALESDLSEAKYAFAEVLSDRVSLSADKLAENLSWSALREEFEDDDGNIDKEALTQVPETSQSGESDEVENEANSGSDPLDDREVRKEVKGLLRRRKLVGDRAPKHSEALGKQAAELAGVESPDDIEMEVF